MPRANPIQVSYNAGEFSPRMVARVDFQKYQSAAALMNNLLVLPQGGVTRRPGTRYIAAAKNADTQVRLLPFVFSTVQAYILEFGTNYLRIYRNQGRVEVASVPVELVTPYAASELRDLSITQSADVLYVAHPNHQPRKITRTSDTDWTIGVIVFRDGPYLPLNSTTTTLNPSGTSGSVTITASSTTGINGGDGFQSSDIGRIIRYKGGDGWTWLEIDDVNSTTSVDATYKGTAVTSAPAATDWQLGAWSETTGWPACVTFFEERLIFAGSDNEPQRFDGSVSADFENFEPTQRDGTVGDDNAISYTLASDKVERIRWILGKTRLIVGTVGGEWIARSEGAILTPSDLDIKENTSHGSANIQPIQVDNVVIFVQRARRKARELVYSFEQDSFVSPDLTILADHITESGVVEMAYQQEPDSVVWCVRDDGQLVSMTYKRDQDVVGWARHKLGGALNAGHAKVMSVATIPGADGSGQQYSSERRDEVWLVVRRTIDGSTVQHIEVMEGEWSPPRREDYATEASWKAALLAEQKEAFFVDGGLTYGGAATTSITGLSHLEGEVVQVLADGGIHPERTVLSGAITLDYEASVVHVGLAAPWEYKSLKMAYGAAAGTAVGKIKRIHRVGFVLEGASVFQMGYARTALDTVEFREVVDSMDTAAPVFVGEFTQKFNGGNERDQRIWLIGDNPGPFTMLAMMPELDTRDIR